MRRTKAVFGILAITLAVVAQVQAQSFLTNGLVACYPFDGNANDASGNNRNGVIVGATPAPDRFNKPGGAFAFSTLASYIVVTNSLHPQGQVTLTYSCWVLFRQTELGAPYQSILNVASAVPGSRFTPNSRSCIGLNSVSSFGLVYIGEDNDLSVSPPALNSNVWYHLVLTKYQTNLTFYLNGIALGSGNTQPGQDVTSETLFIGNNGNPYHNSGEQFYGLLGDIRIYNRALSGVEVDQLYLYESVPQCLPHTAAATAILDKGFTVEVTLNDGGCGYTNTPTVRIIGGGGSGAQAVALMTNGVVVAVDVLDAGSGYINPPGVVIAPPFIPQPTMGIVALPVIAGSTAQITQLDFRNLSPYDNYQLEFIPTARGTWTNFAIPFTPSSSVSTQDVIAPGSAGFFRVKYMP